MERDWSIRSRRAPRGMGFAEIAAAALFMVIVALLGLDIVLAVFGASMNDKACRDAARAAAQGDDATKAWQMAQAALKTHKTDGFFISQPMVPPNTRPQPPYWEYNDYGRQLKGKGDVTPYVTVTTSCNVRVPAPIFFYGAEFLKNGQITFSQTYTFPIVKAQLLEF